MDARDIVLEFVQQKFVRNDIALAYDDDILTTGLLNSLGIMQLVLHLENTFSLEIPPEDVVIEHFVSAQAIHDYLQTIQS